MYVPLILGTQRVELHEGLQLQQTYTQDGSSADKYAQDGRLVRRTHRRNLLTTVSGTGWLPLPLDGVDYDQPFDLHCIAPRVVAIDFASRSGPIPLTFRTDLPVSTPGYAGLADGERVRTAVTLAGNVATLDAVADATSYLLEYWPVLYVMADWPEQQFDSAGNATRWTLTAKATTSLVSGSGALAEPAGVRP